MPLPLFGGQDSEAELAWARAIEGMAAKTEVHRATWGLDEAEWAVDLEVGMITFTNARRKLVVEAPVQVIGTFDTEDSSWLWGWDHPSVPAPCAEHARLARQFGEKRGLPRLTTRKLGSSEEECWRFTALACHLAGAQGGYRGPSGAVRVFMTFGEIQMSGTDR